MPIKGIGGVAEGTYHIRGEPILSSHPRADLLIIPAHHPVVVFKQFDLLLPEGLHAFLA